MYILNLQSVYFIQRYFVREKTFIDDCNCLSSVCHYILGWASLVKLPIMQPTLAVSQNATDAISVLDWEVSTDLV